jgi:hypothetical protein
MNFSAGKVSNFSYEIFSSRYASDGKYMFHINNNILPLFDKEQLHIYVAEYAKRNPRKEMNKVFDFLGVSHLDYPKKVIDGNLLKHRTRSEDIKLNRTEKFYRVWSKQKKTISGNLRKQMLDYYLKFNNDLFDFLGYEIKEWSK